MKHRNLCVSYSNTLGQFGCVGWFVLSVGLLAILFNVLRSSVFHFSPNVCFFGDPITCPSTFELKELRYFRHTFTFMNLDINLAV